MTQMLMVNRLVPLQLTRGFIPRLRQRRAAGLGAGIILTSSVEGLIGCPYSTPYSATKALVKSLGQGLWGELHPGGIDVLTLCPRGMTGAPRSFRTPHADGCDRSHALQTKAVLAHCGNARPRS